MICLLTEVANKVIAIPVTNLHNQLQSLQDGIIPTGGAITYITSNYIII